MMKDNKYDWLTFARSFLDLANLGCDYLLGNVNKKNKDIYIQNIKIGSEEPTIDYVIPILFNIKHGIECYIKTILRIMGVEFTKNNEFKIHDLNKLFGNLKNKIRLQKIEPSYTVIGKRYKIGEIKNEDIKSMFKKLDGLEEEILYFYKLPWFSAKIKENFSFIDSMNDVFRYPENEAKVIIDWEETLEKFNEEDFLLIKSKVKKLHESFSEVGDIVYKHYRNKKIK